MHRPIRRFTPAEYYRMRDVGVLTPDDDIELLRGLLVLRFAHTEAHETALRAVQAALAAGIPTEAWIARSGCSIACADSVPRPDLVLVPASSGADADRIGSSSVGLVIEIADRSLDADRLDKLSTYARDGISVYWIVNLVDRQLEVYEQPTGASPSPTYGVQRIYKPGDTVALVLGGVTVGTVDVVDLLP